MQARADRTRRIILKAAAETFEAQGYLGTTLQDVVAGRNVSKGALYFHFSSKEQLAATIIEEHCDLLPEALARLRGDHPRAITLLLAVSHQMAARLRDDVTVRAGTRLACEREQLGTSAPTLFDRWIAAVTDVLDEAAEQGDLLPGTDTGLVAEFVITAFAGMLRRGHFTRPGGTPHRHLTTMWRLLLPGLVVPERLTEAHRCLDGLTGLIE